MQWLVGPWIWDTSTGGCWRPPAGFTGLDLRALPAQGTFGSDPKLSLFFGDPEKIENASDYISLGVGPWTDLKPDAKQRSLIPSRRGYTPAGDTLQAIIFDLLCNGADPLGLDCHKPLIPDSRMRLELYAAGEKRSDAFAWGEKHTALIRDVLRADFKALFLATRNSSNPKVASISLKVLDACCEKYKVAKTDWREFVPADLQQDVPGVLPHETTITENFDRADSTTVMGNNLTWTQVTGTWGTTSNKGYKVSSTGIQEARAESALSSADHYSQVLIGAASGVFQQAGPACRFAAAASTYYFTGNYSNAQYLTKIVAGVQTNMTSVARTYASEVLKVQANGSTIKAYAAGTELLSTTDTAITGNLRTGLAAYGTGETFDSFQAADLSSPTTATPGVASLTTTRYAPSVATPRLATPPVKSLSITRYAPVVATPRLATVGKLSLTATKYAPTILLPKLATPGKLSLTTSQYAPTIAAPRLITPGTRSLSATVYAPVVATPRTSTPSVASLSMAGYASTVATPRTATPGRASLTAAGYAPTVLVPRVTVPGVAVLAATAFAPIVTAINPITATPSTRALSLTTYSPVASLGVIVLPGGKFRRPVALLARSFSRDALGRIFRRTAESRSFSRDGLGRKFHRSSLSRTWSYAMSANIIPVQTLTKAVGDDRYYLCDLTKAPEIVAGATIASAEILGGSGLTIGSPSVLDTLTDGIAAGKGVKVRISGGTDDETVSLACKATLSTGSVIVVPVKIAVAANYE